VTEAGKFVGDGDDQMWCGGGGGGGGVSL